MLAIAALAGAAAGGTARAAGVDVDAQARGAIYDEPSKSGRSPVRVYAPSVVAEGTSGDVSVQARYDLDAVSGASERIAHVITSASPFSDKRHALSAKLGYRPGDTRLDLGYVYSIENDYLSHGVNAAMETDVNDRNTTLGASYAHGWDRTTARRDGGAVRDFDARLDVDSVSFSAAQVFTPTLAAQLGYSLTVLRGYQASPYRKVILYDAGPSASFNERVEPESHPDVRVRHALVAKANRWFEGPRAALSLSGRVYDDSWGVQAASLEASWTGRLGGRLGYRLRARAAAQTAAVFYRDRYERGPVGRYFTGDRELADMADALAGLRLDWKVGSGEGSFWDGVALMASLDGLWIRRDLGRFGTRDTSFTLEENPANPSQLGRFAPDDGQSALAQIGVDVRW